jgi:hypothetical protein
MAPGCRVLLEKVAAPQIVIKFLEFYGFGKLFNAPFTVTPQTCPYLEPD